MKKFLIITALLACAVLLFSCGCSAPQETQTADATGSSSDTQSESPDTEWSYTDISVDYIIDEKSGSKKSYAYPSFSCGIDSDGKISSEITKNILAYSDMVFSRAFPTPLAMIEDGATIYYDVKKYDVAFLSDKYASLVFEGDYRLIIDGVSANDIDAQAGEIGYCVNVDMTSGKLLEFSDIVSDFEKLKLKFAAYEFLPDGDNTKIFDSVPPSEMMSWYREDYEIYPDVYFTDKSFGVIIDVGNAYGVVKFELAKDSAKDFLKIVF